MQRLAVPPSTVARASSTLGFWLARRWYYTPKTHRAYSVRQISPGDRRLLAEFVLTLTRAASERDREDMREFTELLLDRVLGATNGSAGFIALENTTTGDRVIGVSAYATSRAGAADFRVAVANSFREEQVGRTLLSTLLQHARRVGVVRLDGEMFWSNRAMQVLATSMGFAISPLQRDRSRRSLVLPLK
jgi:GNAT superfamily N-acetyltransferase